MTWLKLDDKFPHHPKVVGLSDVAFRLHMSALSHCAEYETDGRVVAHAVTLLTNHTEEERQEAIKDLVDAGLWELIVGGWEIHDFLEWNPSKAELKANRRRWSDKKKKQRIASNDTECPPGSPPECPQRDIGGESGTGRVFSGSGSGSDAREEPKSEARLRKSEPPKLVPVPESLTATVRRAYGEGVRSVIDGPPFRVRDDEAEQIVAIVAETPAWVGLRGDALAQVIRKSAADYARARQTNAQYEKGFSPVKWAEWRNGGSQAQQTAKGRPHDRRVPLVQMSDDEPAWMPKLAGDKR